MPIPRILQESDAVLARMGLDLVRHLMLYTVPLYFLKGESLVTQGSGVIVELKDHLFVLTAGHCAASARDHTLVICISNSPHSFRPEVLTSNHRRFNTGEDYGYIEIHYRHKGTIQAQDKLINQPRVIVVTGEVQAERQNDWMVLAGYPSEITTLDEKGRPGVRLFAYATVLAGLEGVPQSMLDDPPQGLHAVDLWVPEHGNINSSSGMFEPIRMPILAGMSGGGCWRSGVRLAKNQNKPWDTNMLRLVAIHCGSTAREVASDNAHHVFSREVLVGHHLSLIAEDHPELREYIYDHWEQVRHWSVES